jgi:DNA-binding CsgD family transcriptional regulator
LAAALRGRRSECEFLDAVLADALAGRSRAVVLRGEAGVGKTSLLEYVAERGSGWRTATAVGIQSEMELPYSGLHQLCAPMLEHLDRLPSPQRNALATVFGYETGPVPDRFLVGLATLTLVAEVADQQPLLCVVDDAQWLDDASAQIVLFVARRLLAEHIALVCAARTGIGDGALAGLPVLPLAGLGNTDARALLLENLRAPLDAAVCEQLLTESHGNPLALIELPRTWNVTDVAGGFGLPARQPVASRIENSFAKRLLLLPSETQLLVLIAAAEPLGDPLLLHRAAEVLNVGMAASGPAVDAGLLDVTRRVKFAHPLVRSASYRSASTEDRHRVHGALADATDPERDPDRRVWHRACSTQAPDEDVAAELEHSAGRAQARGGVAAAAAFLERAASFSLDEEPQARRSLAAAEAKQLAGAPQTASTLLAAAVDGPLEEVDGALAERLKGQIALDLRRGGEALPLLLDAAARLEGVEPTIARETYLEALMAASFVNIEALRRVAEAARNALAPKDASSADDLMLAGLALRFTEGYAAGASLLKRALRAYRDEDSRTAGDARWPGIARRVAPDLFDDEAWRDLDIRSVRLARDRGALGVLPLALNNLAVLRTFEGELEAAAALVDEADGIADVTGAGRIPFGRLILAGFRGDEAAVSAQIEADTATAIARGEGLLLTVGAHVRGLLYNGLGRYDDALAAAESGSGSDALCTMGWSLTELVEAATRLGKTGLAADALQRLTERTQAAGTEWALGIETRSRALLETDAAGEALYLEAIDRLGRCSIAPEQARAHLVYGEWLRRAGRRVDAREQLRRAHDMLAAIGMDAFAERARRELAATGEKVRRRVAETRDELTTQEMQIAGLARDGHSNPEIAAQLFLSARTVEWHLRKVFAKLGISSRKELETALPETQPA